MDRGSRRQTQTKRQEDGKWENGASLFGLVRFDRQIATILSVDEIKFVKVPFTVIHTKLRTKLFQKFELVEDDDDKVT